MTPQTPLMDRPMVEQPQAPAAAPIGAPVAGYTGQAIGPMAGAPSGWYAVPAAAPVAAPKPAAQMMPSPGMRLGLAIASVALYIPLLALGIGAITTLAGLVEAGVAVTVGLIIVAISALMVVAVNLLFNADILFPRR